MVDSSQTDTSESGLLGVLSHPPHVNLPIKYSFSLNSSGVKVSHPEAPLQCNDESIYEQCTQLTDSDERTPNASISNSSSSLQKHVPLILNPCSLLDKLVVICPNSEHCDEVLCRCDLESHLTYWCRGTLVPCVHARVGCQFRAARALQSEHRRECRFQARASTTTSPVVRPLNKAGVRFGPMPTRRGNFEPPLLAMGGDFYPVSGGLPSAPLGGARCRSLSSPIRDFEVTTIELMRKPNEGLGISFVGGSDTPLLCIVIQEIYLDGIVSMDARLRPGDQILEANGVDLTQATHHQARVALSSFISGRPCELTVYRERATNDAAAFSSTEKLLSAGLGNPFENEEILRIILIKRHDKKLGIKLVGKKNLPGLYILGLVPDGEADLDGRLHKDDRILEINGIDLREGTQEEAANIIRSAEDQVSLVVARVIRPQTPDIIRTTSGEIAGDYRNTSAIVAPKQISPFNLKSLIPASLKTPCDRLCREQVVTVSKLLDESLGMSVAGGVASQRGDTPVYVTNLDQNGVISQTGKIAKGDVLLAVNEIELLGLSHERAVEALKTTSKTYSKVTIRLLEGPETSTMKGNFLPSWLYWLQLPRYCQIPRTITLTRSASGSLGFSIVGGNNSAIEPNSPDTKPFYKGGRENRNIVPTVSASTVSSPQPIVVKSIVPSTPAHRDSRLKCGDLLLAVNGYPLTDVSHAHAVALLKHCTGDVYLRVVSWPGTIV